MRNVEQTKRRGFTLIEIVLVLMILAILAGIVVPLISQVSQLSTPTGNKSDRRIVTETTTLRLRDVMMSTGDGGGIWADIGHRPDWLPRRVSDLFRSRDALTGPTRPKFDPVTKIGWRGPYVTQPTGTYPDIDEIHQTTGNTWSEDGFTSVYGVTGDVGFVDAWGNPIVLQIEFDGDTSSITASEAQAARFVSAGPNGRIDWLLSTAQGPEDYVDAYESHSIDDVVVYLGIVP